MEDRPEKIFIVSPVSHLLEKGGVYEVVEWNHIHGKLLPTVRLDDPERTLDIRESKWEPYKPDFIRITEANTDWVVEGKVYEVLRWNTHSNKPRIQEDGRLPFTVTESEWEPATKEEYIEQEEGTDPEQLLREIGMAETDIEKRREKVEELKDILRDEHDYTERSDGSMRPPTKFADGQLVYVEGHSRGWIYYIHGLNADGDYVVKYLRKDGKTTRTSKDRETFEEQAKIADPNKLDTAHAMYDELHNLFTDEDE